MSPRSPRHTRRPIEELRHHIGALERHHEHLEARLRDALSALASDAERIGWITAEKLKVQDEIARFSADLRPRIRPRRGRVTAAAATAAIAAE
jgi:hypothetical protein